MINPTMLGQLFTVSAPSGAGKTSLLNALVSRLPQTLVSVSHTTRTIRPGEKNGTNYNFVSIKTFQAMIASNGFLEHAKVFGNFYGTSKQWVEDSLKLGKNVVLEVDWQGARQIKARLPNTHGVFILPPSREILEQRLNSRGQDNDDVIEARMAAAKNEISHYNEADHIIINDDFEAALVQLMNVIQQPSNASSASSEQIQTLLSSLL